MVAAIVLSILPCCRPFDDPDDFPEGAFRAVALSAQDRNVTRRAK
jgi:hypothetical protein